MCIMEIRPGQHSATMAQAMAHNVGTIERDLEMFAPLLAARGEVESLERVAEAKANLESAYRTLLGVFAAEVSAKLPHDHATLTGHEAHGYVGTERYVAAENLTDLPAERAHFGGDLLPAEPKLAPVDRDMIREAASLAGRAGFDKGAWIAAAMVAAKRAERYETR